MKKIYLDNAATTPVSSEVFLAMKPFFLSKYGNASEPHQMGRDARLAIDGARQILASFFGSKPSEIMFTSSATESINLSHKGLIEAITTRKQNFKPHIITSSIEHKAVIETCKHLEKAGLAEVTFLTVDKFGMVSAEEMVKQIRPNTVLISIMYVNNEVGTIQPIADIGKQIKQLNQSRATKDPQNYQKIYFHTDATQAIQYQNCQVDYLGVDLLSLTGHKLYAPKGVGALYIRSGTPITRQIDGGDQERKLRAGTENSPYIVGLGKAVELVIKHRNQGIKKLARLQKMLTTKLTEIPGVYCTGHPISRVPHIASFIIEGVEGEALVLLLSNQGVFCSSGSACASETLTASHVLTSMGIPPEISHGSLRISLGKDTNEEEIDYLISVLPGIIKKLRVMAPKIDYTHYGQFI